MASQSLGGLYVSVGLDAQPAVKAAQALELQLLEISSTINNLNKRADLSGLRKQFDQVASSAERAAKAASDASSKAARGAEVAGAGAAREYQRQASRQVQIDQQVLEQRLRLHQEFNRRIDAVSKISTLTDTQAADLAVQRELAAKARAALLSNQITEAEYNKKLGLIQRNVTAIERAAQAEIRANQQAAQSAQQKMTVLNALFGNSQNLLIGAGAFKSGNFFYGTAAVGGYFKSLLGGLKEIKAGASQASAAIDSVGAAAGGRGMAAAALVKVGAIWAGIGVAAAAAVPLVGVALTAVGAKIAQFGLEQATNIEMLKIQYEGLLSGIEGIGNAAAAASREVQSVLQLGTESIVPTEQLLDANRLLLAFGVENEAARRSLLEYISAFSSVTGASLTQVQNLSYALGQINAAGKANAIDLRQLANAGVSTSSIFAEIAKQQGISIDEAKKLSDEGKLYASVIMPAILARAGQLTAAQDKARDSAYGILVNLKDIAKINAGQAFESLLGALKPVLRWVESFIKAFDFKAVARAWFNVVGYFKEGFKTIGADAGNTAQNISQTIATAINIVGYAAVKIAQAIAVVFNGLMFAINLVWQTVQTIVAGFLYAVSALMEAAASIPNPWQESARSVADSTWKMAEEASKGAKVAGQAWVDSAAAAGNAFNNLLFNNPAFKPVSFGKDWDSFRADRGQKAPGLPEWGLPPGEVGGGGKGDKAVQDYLDRILALLKKVQDAGKSLAEALTLPFAEAIKAGGAAVKTAAEEAFSSMNIDTIVKQFSDLKAAVTDYYAPLTDAALAGSKSLAKKAKAQRDQIVADLRSQTYELVRLASENQLLAQRLEDAQKAFDQAAEGFAKSREKLTGQYQARQKAIARQFDDYYTASSITEGTFTKGALTRAQEALDVASKAYEEAQAKLDALKEARDSFLSSVAESIRSFVNNLAGVAKEIQTFTRLDDIGSFSMTSSSKVDLDSFKKSLQDRLDALKQWRAQVADLMKRGLDSDFLKSLVSSGPEASKDVVAALAGASNSELSDINKIQSELASEISTLQSQASAQWFDAGIAAQEAFTAPLKAAYEAAQRQVSELQAQKDMALGVLEAWYAEQNELIDSQEAAAKAAFDATREDLEKKMGANQKKAEEIAAAINGIWSKLPGKAYIGGVNTMVSLIEGLKSKEGALKAEANRIADMLQNTIKKALEINSPSKVMEAIGEDTVDGLILGMEKSGLLQDTTLNLSGFVNAASTLPEIQPQETTVQQEIRVYLGDKELTDLVDVQIQQSNNVQTDLVIAGRRY